MFSIELKFTVDCLKFWFKRAHKINNLELRLEDKNEFIQKNKKTDATFCCLCNFFIESRATNGWSSHVFRAEHLFLENIYSEKQMKLMGIDNFDVYCEKLNSILNQIDTFCESIEFEIVLLSKKG